MRTRFLFRLCLLLLSSVLATPTLAQVPLNPAASAADTTHKYENPAGVRTPRSFC